MTPKTEKKILVLAAARSGTRYLWKCLMLAGVDIGHERWKVNGTIAPALAVDDYFYAAHWEREKSPRRRDIVVDESWHQVRHPLDVISSWETGPNLSHWHWQQKHTRVSWDERPFVRAARYWLAWNDIIDADCDTTLRYRIEDIESVWPEMMRRLGMDEELPDVARDFGKINLSRIGKTERVKARWEDLAEYEEPVRLMAKEYGYED